MQNSFGAFVLSVGCKDTLPPGYQLSFHQGCQYGNLIYIYSGVDICDDCPGNTPADFIVALVVCTMLQ